MGKDYEAIIREIIGHITKKCMFDDISEFYVGITDDPDIRLFDEHNVNKEFGCWTYYEATNDQHAREVEKRLIAQGMEGGSDGGDDSSTWVYCYKITSDTEE